VEAADMGKRPNPRKIPRTQADVDKAFNDGIYAGVHNATAIFLNVLLDKFGAKDHIRDVWLEINKLSESVIEGRVSIQDIVYMLKTEYDIEV
jgi:CRISPR/Cas system-associated protein Csx1